MKKRLFILLNIQLFLFSCYSRQGNEIYKVMFGETKFKYEVISSQDHTNMLDCCIWLHVKAEKNEIIRISQLRKYTPIEISEIIHIPEAGKGEVPIWFKPINLKNGFMVSFPLNENETNWQSYYISGDTTEVYIVDSVS